MRSSSSSKRGVSAMSGTLPAQLGDLTLDFGVDVEWWLAPALAALVAGHDELADLVAQARIDGRTGQAPDLGFHVHRGLALAPPVLVPRRHELANRLVALAHLGRRGGARRGRRVLVAHGERAPADVV